MFYIICSNAETSTPTLATPYTSEYTRDSILKTLNEFPDAGLTFIATDHNGFYRLSRTSADPIPVNYEQLNLTTGEQAVLRAMMPEQCYQFIPTGMSDISLVKKWLANTGVIMTLESIKGIIGSLTKKRLLFSEVMEERNGKKIYFSYEHFDQNKANFFALAKEVGFDTTGFKYIK